ncbi:hypothetical protein JW905_17645 [bacterium]|nr:hypothetical protein [candidate division CSSED10-310 bacterium]
MATIVAQAGGATVMSGKDYLRMAGNEAVALDRFIARCRHAASHKSLCAASLIYLVTPPTELLRKLPEPSYTAAFNAPIDVLANRFAKRLGNRIGTSLEQGMLAMLSRQAKLVGDLSAGDRFDSSRQGASDIAAKIVARLTLFDAIE